MDSVETLILARNKQTQKAWIKYQKACKQAISNSYALTGNIPEKIMAELRSEFFQEVVAAHRILEKSLGLDSENNTTSAKPVFKKPTFEIPGEDFAVDESEEDGYEEPAPEPQPSAPQNKAVKGMLGSLLKQKG